MTFKTRENLCFRYLEHAKDRAKTFEIANAKLVLTKVRNHLQRATTSYNQLQWVTMCYNELKKVTRTSYNELPMRYNISMVTNYLYFMTFTHIWNWTRSPPGLKDFRSCRHVTKNIISILPNESPRKELRGKMQHKSMFWPNFLVFQISRVDCINKFFSSKFYMHNFITKNFRRFLSLSFFWWRDHGR